MMTETYHRAMQTPPRYWTIALLMGILIVSAVLRFADLGLIELKGDEAVAIHMALPMVEGQSIPKVGLVNSVGLRNPPLFIYLTALPTWLSVDPRFVTAALVGLTMVLAIALTFFVVRRRFGEYVGTLSALFFAIAPWSVLYGRKLWAQDVLPAFCVALMACFFTVQERTKTKWVAAIPILLCALWQLHLSAVGLILVTGVYLIVYRRRIHWPALIVGTVVATVMLTPYVMHQVQNDWQDIRGFQRMAEGKKPDGTPRESEKKWSLDGVVWSAYISAGNDVRYACGPSHDDFLASQSPSTLFIRRAGTMVGTGCLLFGLLFCVLLGLMRLMRRQIPWLMRLEARLDPLGGSRTLLWWSLGYLLVFTALRLEKVFPHYYIILYPAQFILMALMLGLIRQVHRSGQYIATALVLIIALANVLTIVELREFVKEKGGTAGDYGVAYQYKDELAQYVAASGMSLDGWRGWEYGHLVDMVRKYGDFEAANALLEQRGLPPEHHKKARIYNLLRQPQYAARRCLGRQDFGPLVLCPTR